MPHTDTHECFLSDADRPIWGASRIARELGISRWKFLRCANLLPVSKIGNKFVTTPRRLREALNGEVRK